MRWIFIDIDYDKYFITNLLETILEQIWKNIENRGEDI